MSYKVSEIREKKVLDDCKSYKTICGCLEENVSTTIEIYERRLDKARYQITVSVDGCCGGGCFTLSKLKYCPYCQIILEVKEE